MLAVFDKDFYKLKVERKFIKKFTIFADRKNHNVMKRFLLLVYIVFLFVPLQALPKNKVLTSIPFEMVGGYIVINVSVNEAKSLRFILDSGVRNTIITELHEGDNISLNYTKEQDVQGLGRGNSLNAMVSESNVLKIGKLKLTNKTILVLKDDFLNLSLQTGTKINGLLGVDFFQNYTVQLDYSSKRIKFYDNKDFEAPKGYGVMPMTIERQKMFIHLSVLETDTARRSIKMLIDTGAQLNAWFQTLTNKSITIPEKSIKGKIGEGLSGEVTGIFARVPQICIANFCVKNPIVVFPDSAAIYEIIKNSDRDGTIGSQLLSRFNLIIDIFNKKFYFKPNSTFNNPFTYNIAGIEVAQTILFLPQIEVVNVWKGSPAEKAGIKTGDIISEINFEKVFSMSLSQARGYFDQPSKKPLKMKILRENEEIKVEVEMNAKI